MKLKPLIDECLGLMRQLEKEQPLKPDLEALHAVCGVYARLRSYREKIQEYPGPVRSFCEFLQAEQSSLPVIKSFFALLRQDPQALRPHKGESFLEQKQRIAGIAQRIGLEARELFHLLSLARLKGLLDQENELTDIYHPLVNEFFIEKNDAVEKKRLV
jgi:hypothetical protein